MQFVLLFLVLCISASYSFKTISHFSLSKPLQAQKSKNIFEQFSDLFTPQKQQKKEQKSTPIIESYEAEINAAKSILLKASRKEIEVSKSDEIVNNLVELEKLMRKQNKADEGRTAEITIDKLNGAWRLVFTTGTVETQKKVGRINYFPLKAVQCFDTTELKLTNGIYINDFAVLKFFGPFEFNPKSRKLVSVNVLKLLALIIPHIHLHTHIHIYRHLISMLSLCSASNLIYPREAPLRSAHPLV